jgi:PAS domain S-box-containing protein
MKKRTRNPRLVRHDRSLGAFAAVAKAVSQTLDLEQLLDIALAKVFEVMDLGRGVIYLLDTGARELVLKAHRGVPEQLVGALGRIEVTEADIQLWLEHREQAFKLESVFDQATLTRVRSAVGKQREQSYVVTPLWSKEMLRGAMILESRSKCWFGPEELELLQAIGNQIAVAIENAELFEQTRASAEELKVSEAKYRRLVEDMNDGYMVVNWRGKIAFANGKLAEISGYKLKELIGEDAAKLAPPESIPYSLKLARRLEQRRRVRGHLGGALLKKDGERVPVELSLKAIEYEGGPAVALVIRDITERKRAEEEMRVKDSAIESSINAIALAGLEGNLIYVNPSFLRLWGYDNDKEALGKPSVEFWQEAEEAAEIIGALFKKGSWQGELVALKKDGSTFDAQLSGSVVRDEDGKPICMMASFIDITKRKRAEEELLRHTERIEVTAELTRIITSSLNIEDVYEPFADGVKRLVDFDRFSIVLVEGDKARLVAVVSAVETELSTGVIAPLEGSAAEWVVENKRTNIETDFAQERQFPADEAHLRSGLRSAIRLPLFSRGEVIGTFNLSSRRSHAYGEREQEILEELAGRIAVAIENAQLFDEAQAKIEELKAAQEYLVQTERQRALAEMAGGVAHDFNNVLSIVLGRAQLALEDTKEPKLKESLQVIERSVYDAANMVRRLQEFTGATVGEKLEALDLNQVVKSALQMVETRRAENQVNGVKIDIDADLDEVYTVEGNPAELRGVLVNIIFNAMDALPQGGRIAVKTARENSWALISISDTGTGMTEEVKWRIFDPFFTTKGSRGSGLGLSASHGIISKHGGSIEIDSTLGKGSTFYIRLPIVNGTRRKARED